MEIDEKLYYIPKRDDFYFFIDSVGDIRSVTPYDDRDKYRIFSGNCFKTKEEAEEYKQIQLIEYKLRMLAKQFNYGLHLNYEDITQAKYSIALCIQGDEQEIIQLKQYNDLQAGVIYCLNDRFLEEAISQIGLDNLVKYFLSKLS